MRTTLTLDDLLMARAHALSGLSKKSDVIRESLKAFIARESARRLALLGGSEPQLRPVRRRQTKMLTSPASPKH